MKREDKDFLKKVALNAPAAALMGYGALRSLHGDPDGFRTAEAGIAYLGLLLTYRQTAKDYAERQERRIKDVATKAGVLRPRPANLGTIMSLRTVERNADPEDGESIKSLFAGITNVRMLTQEEKARLNYPPSRSVFATRNSVISFAPGMKRDLVVASAAGATLQDEGSKQVPLLKPAAVRMAVMLGTYPDATTAEAAWDEAYDRFRGRGLLEDAVRETGDPGAIVMDGPLALRERGGTLMKWGDYRYIGFDRIEGVETADDAEEAVRMIESRGVYDADRAKPVALRDPERHGLARSILAAGATIEAARRMEAIAGGWMERNADRDGAKIAAATRG